MRRSTSALRIALGGAAAGTFVLVQSAAGQNAAEPAGLRFVIDYSAGIDVDTNEQLDDPSPGTYSAITNTFDFALLSDTRNQSFALGVGGQLRFQSDPESEESGYEFEWRDPVYTLQYSREAANARLGVSASLQQRDVDTLEPFFVDLDGDTIVDDRVFDDSEGTLNEANVSATLETGINAPIGTAYTASYQSRTYSETEDPGLYDEVEYRLSTSTRLRFSGVSTGRLNLSARQYEYSGGRDTLGETYSASFGLNRALSQTLSLDASLGYSKTYEEETVDGVDFVDENQGPNASLSVSREVSDGSYYVSYDRSLVDDSFRNTLTFGRNISRATYDVSASVGLAALDDGDPVPTFDLTYSRPLATGAFSAALSRSVTVDTDDEERTLTSAVIGYSQAINDASSFNIGFDYSMVTSPDEAVEDESRATFRATYTHSLTRDWDMSVGYRARTQTSDSEDAISNAVFVNLGRSFLLRP